MRDEGAVVEYGRFGVLSRVELERFFHLDDEDHRLIAARRRDYNRLGFAIQLVTVRYLGMFLPDPLDVPTELVDYLASQLEIADPACVKTYTDREKTKLEHAWEIQREYGLISFADIETELLAWITDQAWMTGDGPKALTAGAVVWLREHNALLPGATTLERLVTEGKQVADQRLWTHLSSQLAGGESGTLLGLLDTREDGRRKVVELERLRKGAFTPSSRGMANALARVRDLNAVVPESVDVSEVPPRRLIALASHGLNGKTSHLRRMKSQRDRLLALLTATVLTLRAKAVDDALELFDLLMVTDLIAKADRQSKDEKLRRYPRVTRNAGKLARAVRVLLEMSETEPELSLALVWDPIENTVSKAELRAALASIDELVPQADPEFDSQRLEELAGRFSTVRAFLPPMMRTIDFGATGETKPVLSAMHTLADMISPQRTRGLSARWLDARRIDHDLVSGGWQRLVYPSERPEETVDRASYTLCVLEQFHRHLKYRNIFAEHSSKWRDPRAHLLSGMAWESARDTGMNALGLPDNPNPMLAELAKGLDASYRDLAARLGDDAPASVDEDGKLHVAALSAVPDPPSLTDLRRRAAAMMPRVDLPEQVLEVMSWHPEFAEAFTHVAGSNARVADLGVSVAAVLCAHSMNVGFAPVVSPGAEALTRDRLHHVDQHYIRPDTMATANTVLVKAQASVPLAQLWGGGLVASVDGMRFVVPVRTIHARPNRKYFGPKRGTTWLNMLNDQAAGLNAMIVSGTPRDSLNAVDVILRQPAGSTVPEDIITDTGSYSDIVFGILHLLGRKYRPQLANLPDQRLWRIEPAADYGPLNTAARGRIDLGKISAHWEDMCRVAVSMNRGEVSAHEVTRMISRDGNPTSLGHAIAHYGRIFKTLHILRLADDEPYRREAKAQANLIEGRHDLGRTIFHGHKGEITRAYLDGMEDQLSALGLILNCVVLWNTVYLDRALDELRAQDYPVHDEDATRLSAFMRRHIRLAGHYSFQLPELTGGHRPLRDPDAADDD
ncbi:Tn3 family transposase [Rhodococcus sp. 1168]|uniref:Tn3 family transposase n=1 Tax=Rhodococcus sp. 1168 TaxID=2018041 RepID=UPI000A0B6B22|nr:Tn3 family transposase [Rhodococcus sp. 1168]ORI20697.1 DDE transposase [Rhodococcus sp. 1168]